MINTNFTLTLSEGKLLKSHFGEINYSNYQDTQDKEACNGQRSQRTLKSPFAADTHHA